MNKSELKKEQKLLYNTIERIKNQSYYVWELITRQKNKFNSGNYSLGDEVTYQRGKQDSKLLERAEKNPYFGSFEIVSEDGDIENYYIGKQGIKDNNENVVVVDWRMPIASVFYNFTPGASTQRYTVNDEKLKKVYKYTVDVLRKKEYTIKDQKLIKIIQQVAETDSELNKTITELGDQLTITDDFLKEIIENSETTGYLKEIIATIQAEQNKAIRQPIDLNVIIQGVAGSGKSSIALHRLSYLLYNNKNISPEKVVVLGPSNLFISSVKDLLPDLSLEGIKHSTVQELILDFIKPALKSVKFDLTINKYFEDLLFLNGDNNARKIIKFKGSESFAILLDIFISDLITQYENLIKPVVILDVELDKETLLSIYEGYKYLPFKKRIERFLVHVENHIKRVLEERVKDLEQQLEFVNQTFLIDTGLKQDELTALKVKMQEITKYKVQKIRTIFKLELDNWKKNMKGPSLLDIYKQVLSFEVLNAFKHELAPGIPDLFSNYKLNKVTYFDLAPLFYIYLLLYDKPAEYSHIVIDEAQDLCFIHFAALKKITKTMTLLGDKDQSIFMKYGQYDWDELNNTVFKLDKNEILTLDTSYRSTKEIIDAANTVLSNQNNLLHSPIIPLNRSGEKVNFVEVTSGRDLLDNIIHTIKEWKKKYKRIALIHKDEQKARKVAEYLTQEYNKRDVVYISPEQEVVNKSISVLASYHCKGMEFDAVILLNINAESFPKDDLHSRLLYVLLTRAQQEVKVFYQDTPSSLLEGLIPHNPKEISVFDDIL
ncbi:HelD family protein [Bacillus sp. Marseille-P3661]|uniref:HelD family protein n=1 Tax=Bacillus sp. Marseille-P3661 TaxID=1936234 RepID=UPI000C843FC4|nr:3'-5' exonuclease [Bacillus sp. Marseille-P3661]